MGEQAARELVNRVQAGDTAAVGELFTRFWRGARAVAYGVTGDWAAAEDAAAEGFSKAIADIHSLQDPDRFAPWLRTIVVRRARTEIPDARLIESVAEELVDPSPCVDKLLERRQLAVIVQQAMRQLPEALREAVTLHYFENYGPAETATFLDIPASTLRRRLHDGRERLRREIKRFLTERHQMHDEGQRELKKFEAMIAEGHVDRAMREILGRRRPTEQLLDLLRTSLGGLRDEGEFARAIASILEQRTRNPAVGDVAQAIRLALPEFQEWKPDVGAMATRFFSAGEYSSRLQATLPPGFSEGRAGAFVKSSRALLRRTERKALGMYENLQEATDAPAWDWAQIVISEVLDLTWMVMGPLDMRSVHERIERLIGAVLNHAEPIFSAYHEPRYRSAFQLHFSRAGVRAATGGVLTEWPGRPSGVDAAHVRIFLEPWASVRSGQPIQFDGLGLGPIATGSAHPRPEENDRGATQASAGSQ